MRYISPEIEAEDRKFYAMSKEKPGALEIPADVAGGDERRGWAYRHGCGAIGFYFPTKKWYAYN